MPICLARVLAHDKPSTLIQDDYFESLIDQIGFPHWQVDGIPGWIVSSEGWRLDILPTTKNEFRQPDPYHKRLGVVFGYPSEAIDYFIHKDKSEPTKFDLVNSGEFTADEVAYTRFLCYNHLKMKGKFQEGKT